MKQTYTLLAAFLMLAATALWSGCSNTELADIDSTPGEGSSQTVETFSFSIKNAGAQTRATGNDFLKEGESTIKTMYVALFLKDSGNEQNSKLHRIYCLDEAADAAFNAVKMTETGGIYTIENPGTVGDYVVYFIANPDNAMKSSLVTMHTSSGENRATLSTLESTLQTGNGTADGKTDGAGALQTEADKQRGFIMVGKENITLSEYTSQSVTLNRLAARFDFINSATSAGNTVTITKVEINKGAQSSVVAALSSPTAAGRLTTLAPPVDAWTNQSADNYFTTYAYENLTTAGTEVTSITVSYTLDAQKKKLTIQLKKDGVALGVTRNHLYRIYLNGVSGEYKLVVADWNEGETVMVPNEDLAIEYKATDLGKIGDYVYRTADNQLAFSDGGLRKIAFDGSLTWETERPAPDNSKGSCIAIIFSENVSAKDKARGWSKYAFAVKSGGDQQLCGHSEDNILPVTQYLGEALAHLDGYENSQLMLQNNGKGGMTYPAMEYLTTQYSPQTPVPAKTSGWYIPSVGQAVALATINNRSQLLSMANPQFNLLAGYFTFANTLSLSTINWMVSKLPVGSFTTTNINMMTSSLSSTDKILYPNLTLQQQMTLNGYTVRIIATGMSLRPVIAF